MITLSAEPYEFAFDPGRTALVVIDMQRDFVESGGFGAALGNDVARLRSAIGPIAGLLAAARATGMLVIHTREGHRPNLSDLPPSKQMRGETVPVRPNLGIYTQPVSFIGLPVVSVPVHGVDRLPLGVQVIAAPGREAVALGLAAKLEKLGVCRALVVP